MSVTRDPAVSGAFYSANADELRRDVSRYVLGAPGPQKKCAAVIVPHAGYVYSGRTAGLVLGACVIPAVCVVLAPNHTGRIGAPSAASALLSQAYRTPLGVLRTDVALGNEIVARGDGLIADDPVAHAREHAVEVILPFLQSLRPDVSVVPIVIAWSDWQRTLALAEAIHAAVGERNDVLVVASSDMNHYESAVVSEPKDRAAIEHLLTVDGEGLLETTRRLNVTMCGRVPAATACAFARLRGHASGELIDYRHSGLVNGDVEHVVGYAGVLLGIDQ